MKSPLFHGTLISAPVILVALLVPTPLPEARQQPAGDARPPAAAGGQTAAPGRPAEGGASGVQGSRRAATGVYPETAPDDGAGFVPIFDGKTLDGWDGDTRFWRAEHGEIVAESTPENVVKQNTFLIWRGSTVRDFELKLEFRMNGGNSGIQYRSVEVPDAGKWVLKGYQADVDFTQGYLGNVHDERGRAPTASGHAVLSRRGEITRIVEGPEYKVVGTIGDPTLLRGVMNVGGWNSYHIIARGPVLMQLINGQLMAIALDEDPKHFTAEGVIGFQMHTGPPFKIQFRNVLYRKL